jgi:hypothetical protein
MEKGDAAQILVQGEAKFDGLQAIKTGSGGGGH